MSEWKLPGKGTMRVLCLVAQSCATLCDPMDCSPPGFSVRGILQARILEWVAIPSSRGSSQTGDRMQVSHVAGGFFTSWATREAQEYWWVACPFSRGSSQPRNWTRVSCIAGGFFTNWAIRRACCFPLVKIVCSYLSRNRLVFFISHCLNSIYRGLPPPRLEHQCYLRIEPQINVWI